MAIRIPPTCSKFRAAIIPLMTFILVVSLPGVLCVAFFLDGLAVNSRGLARAFAVILIYTPIMSVLMAMFYAAAFSADGIYGHSFWGVRQFVAWRDITGAKKFRLLNLPWLRIYSAAGKTTWLPLFRARPKEFYEEMRRLAPAGSPVLNHLQ